VARGDQLPVAVDVGVRPVELDIDEGQPDARDRAYARHSRHAIHLRLDREADQLLDFRRRKSFRLGHDGDDLLVQVRQHIDRKLGDAVAAECHQGRAER
jgi:hypothetical protein